MITADQLIAETGRKIQGPVNKDALTPAALAESLWFILVILLRDIDYEKRKLSGAAIAARGLAAMVYQARRISN